MKQLIAIFIFVTFVSCTKEDGTAPSTASANVSSSPLSFTSSNISISGFKAQETDNAITIDFATAFQKDIKTIEILRGTTPSSLCSIYKTDIAADSYTTMTYSTTDKPVAATQYYIVKYTLRDNDWAYTPIFSLQTSGN